jgi:malate dehydrogenase (oxaloacetate-decarboxylating)(NADP+)
MQQTYFLFVGALTIFQGAFTPKVISIMSQNTPRPIIFPLSNPVHLSECTFSEALTYSNGTAIFASGSPFGSQVIGGVRREAGQGNNMYIFPGKFSLSCYVRDSELELSWL